MLGINVPLFNISDSPVLDDLRYYTYPVVRINGG